MNTLGSHLRPRKSQKVAFFAVFPGNWNVISYDFPSSSIGDTQNQVSLNKVENPKNSRIQPTYPRNFRQFRPIFRSRDMLIAKILGTDFFISSNINFFRIRKFSLSQKTLKPTFLLKMVKILKLHFFSGRV